METIEQLAERIRIAIDEVDEHMDACNELVESRIAVILRSIQCEGDDANVLFALDNAGPKSQSFADRYRLCMLRDREMCEALEATISALKFVLRSAHPNKKEHPTMFNAWQEGKRVVDAVEARKALGGGNGHFD